APASPVARRTVSVPTPDSLRRFGGGTFRPRYAWRLPGALMRYTATLTRVLRRERVEIVQCHNVRSLLTIAWAARIAGCQLVWYVKGHLDNPVLDRIAYRVSTRVLFQNETNMSRRYPHLASRYASKIRVVENGIDLGEVGEAES